jgi:hypothetical protein
MSRKFSMAGIIAKAREQAERKECTRTIGGNTSLVTNTLKAYLEDVVVAVFVVDVTRKETLQSIPHWMEILDKYRPDNARKPVAGWLVGNKRDRWFARNITPEEGLREAARWSMQYMETQQDSADDIDALCVNLVRTVYHLALHHYALKNLASTGQCPADCAERRLHKHVYREFDASHYIQLIDDGSTSTVARNAVLDKIQFVNQQFPHWPRIPFSPYQETGSDELSRWYASDQQQQQSSSSSYIPSPHQDQRAPKFPNTELINPAAIQRGERSSLLVWGSSSGAGIAQWVAERMRKMYWGSLGLLCVASMPEAFSNLEED